MTVPMPTYSKKVLDEFASRQWTRAIALLKKRYGLPDEDCKDIFQEAFIVLWSDNNSGKLDGMTASLGTYFLGICINKARELLRSQGKMAAVDIDDAIASKAFVEEKADEILYAFDDDQPLVEKKQKIVRQIVKDLPSPCDKLLWGFFRDNFSMTTLAQMFHYKTANAAKVTKHRCQEKFKQRYIALVNALLK